jgi:hypothetical protein
MTSDAVTNTREAGSTAPVALAAIHLLDQCEALLGRLGDEAYCADSRVLAGGTIGKHLRHCLDHYRAALDAAERGGEADYDRRLRGGDVENRREVALEELARLRERLVVVAEEALEAPMRVRFMLSGDGEDATFGTTFGREIAFAGHHAVHHFAMIRAIACEHGIDADPDFGKAPSTIHHEAGRA